jgi:hypothetical protein
VKTLQKEGDVVSLEIERPSGDGCHLVPLIVLVIAVMVFLPRFLRDD